MNFIYTLAQDGFSNYVISENKGEQSSLTIDKYIRNCNHSRIISNDDARVRWREDVFIRAVNFLNF